MAEAENQLESFETELKSKVICRFCLMQNDKLSNIYSMHNRIKSSAPLPLQVMACVSIEVFTNDGMPSFVCEKCRLTFEHCYKFKQMCKKAETLLKQYPLTGVWPAPLDRPKIPFEILPVQNSKAGQPQKILNKISTEKSHDMNVKCEVISGDVKIISSEQLSPPEVAPNPAPAKPKPKVLNKNSIKILNKDVKVNIEPMLSQPVVKRDNDGNVEIVTQIIDIPELQSQEPDPIKTAKPIETNVFPCPHCERSFPLRQLLDIHMVNHNRDRAFECAECMKAFFSKYDLGKHMLIHTGEKPFKCVVCEKAFTRSTLLHRHEKIHTDIPKYICVHCERQFLSKEEMERHAEKHNKTRPFSCKICNKSFAFKQGLERHEVIHSKNQPYPCQYCAQSFSTPSKLSRHLTAHAGKRPFPCKLCPKSYLLSHHLTRHLRSHREGSGSYKCYDCDQSFTSRDDLIYHSAVHATQNLVCPLCKEAFDDLNQVTDHIKEHAEGEQYACEFCDLIFMTAEKLQLHCNNDHSDDLNTYADYDANNIDNTPANSKVIDELQHDDIIEEYLIEELGDDDQKPENVKEEVNTGDRQLKTSNRKTRQTSRNIKTENPIDILDMDDLDGESKLINELLIEDSSPIEEVKFETKSADDSPPPKKIKTEIKSEISQKDLTKITSTEQIKAATISKIDTRNMHQPTIKTVLSNLPKSVTVSKRSATSLESEKTVVSPTKTKKIEKSPNITPVTRKSRSMEAAKSSEASTVKSTAADVKKSAVVQCKTPDSKSANTKKTPIDEESPENKPANRPATASSATAAKKELVEMVIGDRRVKVQKITVTKAQAAAMAREGRIEMKGDTMLLRQDGNSKKRSGKKTT